VNGSRLTAASDAHVEVTFRTDELTERGEPVKGNRGQFPRFTAKSCNFARPRGRPSALVNSDICLRFSLRQTPCVIVLNARGLALLRGSAVNLGESAAAQSASEQPLSGGTKIAVLFFGKTHEL
jgi:hypothetical protein